MSRLWNRIPPLVRGLALVAIAAVVVIVLSLQSVLATVGGLLQIAFFLAIAFFLFLLWRERRGDLEAWSEWNRRVFYAAIVLAVVDIGPQLAPGSTIARIDDLAPLLPIVRSSPAALLVISDARPLRLAIPTFAVARVEWRERFGRTTGWTSLVHAEGERALFHFAALGTESHDLGMQHALLEKTG